MGCSGHVFSRGHRILPSARATMVANHRATVPMTSTELVGSKFWRILLPPTPNTIESRAARDCSASVRCH
jgi:hypothetical protein